MKTIPTRTPRTGFERDVSTARNHSDSPNDETAELIKRDGVVEEYRNGENQYGRKKSSAVEVHTKYSSEYVKTITALANLRGADGGEANDEFLQFIARRKK